MPTENNTESNGGAAGQPSQPGSGNVNANENQNGNPNSNAAAGTQHVPASGQREVPATPPQASGHGTNFGEVLTAIQAMPEQLVRALRESSQPAQQPRNAPESTGTGNQGNGSQTASQTGSQTGSTTSHTEPGKKTFAAWWFGG